MSKTTGNAESKKSTFKTIMIILSIVTGVGIGIVILVNYLNTHLPKKKDDTDEMTDVDILDALDDEEVEE